MIVTKQHRGQITYAVIEHAFAAEITAFLAAEAPLVAKVYAKVYKPAEIAAMELLEKAWPNSQDRRPGVTVNVGGPKISIGECRGNVDRYLPSDREPLPSNCVTSGHQWTGYEMLALPVDDPLAVEITEYAAARTALNKKIDEQAAQVRGILDTVRTDGQLEERWPEVMTIARPILRIEEKLNVPMVPLDSLNAALGLPAVVEPELLAA